MIRFTRMIHVLALAAICLPAPAQHKADLSRLVVVGDSLAAGYLNGSLHAAQQPHGFASLIAAQKRVALPLPLIAAPGLPNVLELISAGPLPVIVSAPGVSLGRVDLSVQTRNLAVPGQSVQDALTRRPDFPIDSLTDLILGLPGLLGGASRSQVEWAESLAPTTVLVWIGNNDALLPAVIGDPSFLTPTSAFEASFTEVMDRLAATGATLAVANIPDISAVPYFIPAEKIAGLAGVPLGVIGPVLGITNGDFVTLDSLSLALAILADPALGPLPGGSVLTSAEMAQVRAAVDAYNAIIATQARVHGAALVDVHRLTDEIRDRGYVVRGQRLNTDFLGGIFSLDGIHPTYTGYAIIANEFIHELNAAFGAGIPPVSIEQVAAGDPLVLPGKGHPAAVGVRNSLWH
jgi:GDSL-like Lipase/Acylhydrolase